MMLAFSRFHELQQEIGLAENLATGNVIARLKTDYDAELRKAHPSVRKKFLYGVSLCSAASRGLVRIGIELLMEIYASLLARENDCKGRSRSLASSEEEKLQEEGYVFLEYEDADKDDDDGEEEEQKADDLDETEVSNLPEQSLYHVAVGYYRLGEYWLSVRTCDQLLRINANHSRVQTLRGLCLYKVASTGALGVLLSIGIILPAYVWHHKSS